MFKKYFYFSMVLIVTGLSNAASIKFLDQSFTDSTGRLSRKGALTSVVDNNGNTYIAYADSKHNNQLITEKLDAYGSQFHQFGGANLSEQINGGTLSAKLAVDSSNNIFLGVVDYEGVKVFKYNSSNAKWEQYLAPANFQNSTSATSIDIIFDKNSILYLAYEIYYGTTDQNSQVNLYTIANNNPVSAKLLKQYNDVNSDSSIGYHMTAIPSIANSNQDIYFAYDQCNNINRDKFKTYCSDRNINVFSYQMQSDTWGQIGKFNFQYPSSFSHECTSFSVASDNDGIPYIASVIFVGIYTHSSLQIFKYTNNPYSWSPTSSGDFLSNISHPQITFNYRNKTDKKLYLLYLNDQNYGTTRVQVWDQYRPQQWNYYTEVPGTEVYDKISVAGFDINQHLIFLTGDDFNSKVNIKAVQYSYNP